MLAGLDGRRTNMQLGQPGGWLFAAFGRWYCKGRYPLANPSGPRSSLTSFTKAN